MSERQRISTENWNWDSSSPLFVNAMSFTLCFVRALVMAWSRGDLAVISRNASMVDKDTSFISGILSDLTVLDQTLWCVSRLSIAWFGRIGSMMRADVCLRGAVQASWHKNRIRYSIWSEALRQGSVLRAKEAGDIRLSKPFMPVNRCERIVDSESMKMMFAPDSGALI